MPGEIFISYSREDAWYVQRLVQFLDSAGVPAWMDDSLSPGQPGWVRQIEAVIEQSAGLVLVMTPSSATSPWVDREVDLAQELGKPVFPLLLAGRRHLRVRDIQSDEVVGGSMPSDQFLEELLRVVRASAQHKVKPGSSINLADVFDDVSLVGLLGSINFDGTWVTITKDGFGPAMKGERRVHVSQLVGVNFKAATTLHHGFIQIVVDGEAPARPARFGTNAGRPPMEDPLSISFAKPVNGLAEKLRSTIEEAVACRLR